MEFHKLFTVFQQNLQIIHTLVNDIQQTDAQVRPTPDSWSIVEVVSHLLDEEIEDFRRHLEICILQTGEPWPSINPQGWVSERNYNARNLSETLRQFMQERKKSNRWLQDLEKPDWHAKIQAPFGEIHAGDLFTSWVAHDILHIRQLVELRYYLVFKSKDEFSIQYAGEW